MARATDNYVRTREAGLNVVDTPLNGSLFHSGNFESSDHSGRTLLRRSATFVAVINSRLRVLQRHPSLLVVSILLPLHLFPFELFFSFLDLIEKNFPTGSASQSRLAVGS